MIYFDASALVSVFLPDAHTGTVEAFLRGDARRIGVSGFAVAEFSAVVSREARTGRLDAGQGARVLHTFDAWLGTSAEAVPLEPDDARVATAFVRRFDLGLRAPDALHLAICKRLNLPLLTFDARQAAAARALGVGVVPLGLAAEDA